MSIDNQDPIVSKMVKEIFQDRSLSTPVYRADLVTDNDIREKISSLPLIYIWNEDSELGTFIVSVNEVKIEEMLERQVDRSDALFAQYRDRISILVTSIVNQTVAETVRRMRLFPSSLFIGEEGERPPTLADGH